MLHVLLKSAMSRVLIQECNCSTTQTHNHRLSVVVFSDESILNIVALRCSYIICCPDKRITGRLGKHPDAFETSEPSMLISIAPRLLPVPIWPFGR